MRAVCAVSGRSVVAHTNEEADDEGRRRRAGEAARCVLIIFAPSVVVTVVVVVVPSAAVVVVVVVLVDMVGVVVWWAFGFDAEQAAANRADADVPASARCMACPLPCRGSTSGRAAAAGANSSRRVPAVFQRATARSVRSRR
jgi:Flp pilus assembly protein TadB